ncbi:MAG TPA: hypothetical protein VHZ03_50300 [Trebonia sp.]|jgi:hypothetical protein|nr:hypothetical protein [Trebonia sp.]
MAKNIKAVQGNDINADLGWDTETKPKLTGSGARSLKATSSGGRLSLTGRVTESGTFSVTITQTRTTTITIEVVPRKALGDMTVPEHLHHAVTGKRPEANPKH